MIGHSGWGRYLHFLSAWVCVLTGLVYALFGLLSHHFRKNLLPAKGDLGLGPYLAHGLARYAVEAAK